MRSRWSYAAGFCDIVLSGALVPIRASWMNHSKSSITILGAGTSLYIFCQAVGLLALTALSRWRCSKYVSASHVLTFRAVLFLVLSWFAKSSSQFFLIANAVFGFFTFTPVSNYDWTPAKPASSNADPSWSPLYSLFWGHSIGMFLVAFLCAFFDFNSVKAKSSFSPSLIEDFDWEFSCRLPLIGVVLAYFLATVIIVAQFSGLSTMSLRALAEHTSRELKKDSKMKSRRRKSRKKSSAKVFSKVKLIEQSRLPSTTQATLTTDSDSNGDREMRRSCTTDFSTREDSSVAEKFSKISTKSDNTFLKRHSAQVLLLVVLPVMLIQSLTYSLLVPAFYFRREMGLNASSASCAAFGTFIVAASTADTLKLITAPTASAFLALFSSACFLQVFTYLLFPVTNLTLRLVLFCTQALALGAFASSESSLRLLLKMGGTQKHLGKSVPYAPALAFKVLAPFCLSLALSASSVLGFMGLAAFVSLFGLVGAAAFAPFCLPFNNNKCSNTSSFNKKASSNEARNSLLMRKGSNSTSQDTDSIPIFVCKSGFKGLSKSGRKHPTSKQDYVGLCRKKEVRLSEKPPAMFERNNPREAAVSRKCEDVEGKRPQLKLEHETALEAAKVFEAAMEGNVIWNHGTSDCSSNNNDPAVLGKVSFEGSRQPKYDVSDRLACCTASYTDAEQTEDQLGSPEHSIHHHRKIVCNDFTRLKCPQGESELFTVEAFDGKRHDESFAHFAMYPV